MSNEKVFLTVEETAEYLGIPKRKVYNMCIDKEIPAVKLGKYWMVHKAKLEKWAEKVTRV